MYKQIQAFFTSENDAESVKAELEKLKVNKVVVDELEDAHENRHLFPIAFAGGGAAATPASGGLVAGINIEKSGDENDSPRNYTVEGEVEEEDYQVALEIIKDGDGHVDEHFFNQKK